MRSSDAQWTRDTDIEDMLREAYGGHALWSVTVKDGNGVDYQLTRQGNSNHVMVSEPFDNIEGEPVHRTYWINDPLALACFLSDKEQVHGQAGTGKQATYRGLPGTGDNPSPGQGN